MLSCLQSERVFRRKTSSVALAADRATRIDDNQSESNPIQELTPCLPEHVLWSPKRYVFGVRVVFKTVEKTQLFNGQDSKLSDESIWRFLLVVLQYVEQVYQIYW